VENNKFSTRLHTGRS